jgi:hypothetical protein
MSLSGKLEDISILDVIQFIHLGRRTGNLFVWSNDKQAAIVFNAGRIQRVWIPGSNRLSDLTGDSAPTSAQETAEAHVRRTISEVAGWRRGLFELTQDARLVEPREEQLDDAIPDVALDAEQVVLEITRIADELSHSKTQPFTTKETFATAAELVLSDAEKQQMALTMSLVDAEREINRLTKLYVATHQLHASLDPAEVTAAIRDIAINLLGAERFVLLIREEESTAYEVVLSEAMDPTHPLFVSSRYLGGDPAIDGALSDGNPRADVSEPGNMRAVVPLKVQGVTAGALAIFKMVDHKPLLSEDDKELLRLIAAHAASALFAARSYTRANRKAETLEAVVRA